MRRLSTFVPFPAVFLLSLLPVCSAPVSAQQRTPPPSQPGMNPNSNPMSMPVRSFAVNGMVSDAVSHARLDFVKVELQSATGGVIGTTVTNNNGRFEFDNLGPGDYMVVVDQAGYRSESQRVEVFDSSVYGVEIELSKTADSENAAGSGASTVSVRDLSIPPKAREDMQKGMVLLYGKSDYQGSLKAFQKAIQDFPGYYEAYAQIGVAYMRLADAANSEKAFRKSIEVSSDHYADAYVGLAELCLSQRRFDDAEPAARKAIEIDSKSWQANLELARALMELKRPAEAETNALAATKLKPDEPTPYLILANAHTQLQNGPALLDDLNHYLNLAPDGPFAQQARQERDQLQQALASRPPPPTAPQP